MIGAWWLSIAAGVAYGAFINRSQDAVRTLFKTLPVALMALAAWLLGGPPLLVLALALSAAGDFFLAHRGEGWFLAGLVAFLAAHLTYCVLFFGGQDIAFVETVPFYAGIVLVFGIAGGVYNRLRPRLGTMRYPVAIYSGVIAAMAAAALSRGPDFLLLPGAALFMASDIALAFETFREQGPSPKWRPPFIWYAYFAGQALIAAAFLFS